MSRLQRIRTFFFSLLLFLCAGIMIALPDLGYQIIALILSIVLMLRGIRSLIYYFLMARRMVGGKLILFEGIIALDLGLFAFSLQSIPKFYILLYLLILHLISGGLGVMHALEEKRMGSRWRLDMSIGAANILLCLLCLLCIRSTAILVYIYAAGLVYSGCLHMVQTFRKSAIVYIA